MKYRCPMCLAVAVRAMGGILLRLFFLIGVLSLMVAMCVGVVLLSQVPGWPGALAVMAIRACLVVNLACVVFVTGRFVILGK